VIEDADFLQHYFPFLHEAIYLLNIKEVYHRQSGVSRKIALYSLISLSD